MTAMAGDLTADQILNTVFDALAGKLKMEATVDVGDIEIGAVELKDGATDTRAKVGAGTAVVKGDNAVAVKDPVTGNDDDGAVVTDANGSLSGKLRGLVKIFADVWDNATHTLNVKLYGNQTAGTATNTADATVTNASSTIIAANANRVSAMVQVVSGGNIRVTVDGTAATTTKGVQLGVGGAPLVIRTPFPSQAAIKAIREGSVDAQVAVVEVVRP